MKVLCVCDNMYELFGNDAIKDAWVKNNIAYFLVECPECGEEDIVELPEWEG